MVFASDVQERDGGIIQQVKRPRHSWSRVKASIKHLIRFAVIREIVILMHANNCTSEVRSEKEYCSIRLSDVLNSCL